MLNKISVVMSVYNDEDNLEKAIESILSQTYTNFEFLILDDSSTDDSLSVIQKYCKDKRVKLYINKQNLGLTKSLNILVNKSEGKYIFRQDSDDVSLPKRFEKQIEVLEKKEFKVCTSRAINSQNNKIIPGLSSWIPKKLAIKYKNPYIHGTLAIEKKLLKSLNNYDEEYYYSQDYKLYLDLIRKNEKIFEIKDPLYLLNTENNISSRNKNSQKYFFKKALKNYAQDK
tara:strand:+ start:19445 stop:20128 length:684 start_codon:yes stop_codon:yes gene_type:complete